VWKKGSDPREDGMRRDEERPVSGTMLQRKWQRFLRGSKVLKDVSQGTWGEISY